MRGAVATRRIGPEEVAFAAAGGLATVIPPYVVELLTEHFYFLHSSGAYFFFSSFRTPFFIIFVGVASFVVGRRSKRLPLAWACFAASLAGLYLMLYTGCNPTVCYSTGIDGLEPLRSFSFFLAEGLAFQTAAHSSGRELTRTESLLGAATACYGIAYYPVMFTVAGTGLLPPLFSPSLAVALLAALSFVMSARVVGLGESWPLAAAAPVAAYLALAAISIGIAAQYMGEALSLVGVASAPVVVGSILGAQSHTGGLVLRAAKSRATTALLIGVVVLSIVFITPDAVNGTAPDLPSGSYRFTTPVVAGGFNAAPNVVVTGVAANFSFRGTDPSIIQADNYLGAGVGVHSSNCCVDGIDYGYRADVFLYRNDTEVFAASAWEVCDTILACGGHTWKHLMYFSSARLNATVEDWFQLSIRWDNRTATWHYATDGKDRVFAAFREPMQENPDFDAGWLGAGESPSPGGYTFFQFGVMSGYPIERPGWRVAVECPSLYIGATWECLKSVEFFQGDISFWKALWRWGENYPGAGASVDPGNDTFVLHFSTEGLRDFQKAW